MRANYSIQSRGVLATRQVTQASPLLLTFPQLPPPREPKRPLQTKMTMRLISLAARTRRKMPRLSSAARSVAPSTTRRRLEK